mmetsp:Transcript_25588/g.36041  ORF Transcript_25588/g.36041 Transcript_25588/m.36041 type:complete len:670 (-) Transcript_25588:121-2130(-)
MALGLSRDSICNLSDLIHPSDEKDGGLTKNDFDYLSGDEGDSDEVALGMDVDDDDDGQATNKNNKNNSHKKRSLMARNENDNARKANPKNGVGTNEKNIPQKNNLNLPSSSYGKYTGFDTSAYDEDYTYFDPYAPLGVTTTTQQHNNDVWCFPWIGGNTPEPNSKENKNTTTTTTTTNPASFKSPADAYYDDYTGYDPYAPVPFGGQKKENVFCCLFPWATSKSHLENNNYYMTGPEQPEATTVDQATSSQTAQATPTKDGTTAATTSSSRDEDESSTGSEMLGEKLTDKDRLALLARLRLSEPEGTTDGGGVGSSTTSNNSNNNKNNNKDDNGVNKAKTPLKGILKRCSSTRNTRDASQSSNKQNGGRRALFPVYEVKSTKKKEDNRNVEFAPMARVVTVKSQKNMTRLEKAAVWWQKKDFDDFKRTGRLVAKAMLQGGSEVWLMTNPSWRQPGKSTKELHQSATKASNEKDVSNKWWHKFGHSRRGLEHIASIDEGKQRQINVKVAVRAVLDEQRKQRIHRKTDIERIRSVYHQYNFWARELSLAAGASDEEAVQSNFCESRKSREFYIEHHREKEGRTVPSHVPDFMKPSDKNVTSQMLDANTVTQIQLRRNPVQQQPSHDSQISGNSIAKKAAGFGTGDEHVNMSAVLSGMGAVADKTPPSVRAN